MWILELYFMSFVLLVVVVVGLGAAVVTVKNIYIGQVDVKIVICKSKTCLCLLSS